MRIRGIEGSTHSTLRCCTLQTSHPRLRTHTPDRETLIPFDDIHGQVDEAFVAQECNYGLGRGQFGLEAILADVAKRLKGELDVASVCKLLNDTCPCRCGGTNVVLLHYVQDVPELDGG